MRDRIVSESKYKNPILRELARYEESIQEPSIGWRLLWGTDPSRYRSIANIRSKMDDHDLAFLFTALIETLSVDTRTSEFRDRVGKVVLSQWYSYGIGVLELLWIFNAVYFNTYPSIFVGTVMCYYSDRLEQFLQASINSHVSMHNNLDDMVQNIIETNIADVLYNEIQALKSLNLTSLAEISKRVFGNASNVLYSNYRYFSNKIETMVREHTAQDDNRVNHQPRG